MQFLEDGVDELGRKGVRCLVSGRFFFDGEAVEGQKQIINGLRAAGYLALDATDLLTMQAAYANASRNIRP